MNRLIGFLLVWFKPKMGWRISLKRGIVVRRTGTMLQVMGAAERRFPMPEIYRRIEIRGVCPRAYQVTLR